MFIIVNIILEKLQTILMNLKHLILIFLIGFLMVSQVNASDNVKYFDNDTNISFEGMNFTIPMGFGESKNTEDFNDLGSDGKTCFYISEDYGHIVITVISDWMGMSLDEMYQEGASKTTINGHEGWNYTKNNLTSFGYVHDDHGIIVSVTNQSRLYEVIIEK